jgi:hypothetical protein
MPIAIKEADMPKWGWKKSLMYEKILCNEQTKNRPILIELDYYSDAQRCGTCKSNDFIWLIIPPHDYNGGVLCTCWQCRRTWGPLPEERASNRAERELSVEIAHDICKRTGQRIPKVLRQLIKMRSVQVSRARKTGRGRPPRAGEQE